MLRPEEPVSKLRRFCRRVRRDSIKEGCMKSWNQIARSARKGEALENRETLSLGLLWSEREFCTRTPSVIIERCRWSPLHLRPDPTRGKDHRFILCLDQTVRRSYWNPSYLRGPVVFIPGARRGTGICICGDNNCPYFSLISAVCSAVGLYLRNICMCMSDSKRLHLVRNWKLPSFSETPSYLVFSLGFCGPGNKNGIGSPFRLVDPV